MDGVPIINHGHVLEAFVPTKQFDRHLNILDLFIVMSYHILSRIHYTQPHSLTC